MRTLPIVLIAQLALAALSGTASLAALDCVVPHPDFAYVDVDNDGCYTDGVDSDSVDDQLSLGTFDGPADTGLVVPHRLSIPAESDPEWNVANDVWIDGGIRSRSTLRIRSGGTTYINDDVRVNAPGGPREFGHLYVGCNSGCGPTVVHDAVRLNTNGAIQLYDASIGDNVRVSIKCRSTPSPVCPTDLGLFRPVSIGDRFRAKSKGAIGFQGGTSLLQVGEDLKLKTGSFHIDGGSIDFGITMTVPGGISFAGGASINAGGALYVLGGASTVGPMTGPISIASDAKLTGKNVVVRGTDVALSSNARYTGTRDRAFGTNGLVVLTSTDGGVSVGDNIRMSGGNYLFDAGAGVLNIGRNVHLIGAGIGQSIELVADQIAIGPNTVLRTGDSHLQPITIDAATSVAIQSCNIKGRNASLSATGPGGSLSLLDSKVTVDSGNVSTLSAPGGSCDLTGSVFRPTAPDTTDCGSVSGP